MTKSPTPTTKRRLAGLIAAAASAVAVTTLVPSAAQAATWTCDTGGRAIPGGISCRTTFDSSGAKVTTIRSGYKDNNSAYGSGTGTVLRAALYDSWTTYRGDRILIYGGTSCSASTSDWDFRLSFLPDGWDNRISSVEDYHSCDVDLFWNSPWSYDNQTGYINYGDQSTGGGKHLSLHWSNDASSIYIS